MVKIEKKYEEKKKAGKKKKPIDLDKIRKALEPKLDEILDGTEKVNRINLKDLMALTKTKKDKKKKKSKGQKKILIQKVDNEDTDDSGS